jgi:signal transduction histidine kinase
MSNLVERKRVEQELEKVKEEAIAASRAKSRFLATVSHEIRTPLHGILGMAESLMNTVQTEQERECVEVVSSSGNHLLCIINDVLESSRIESGKLTLENAPFSLRKCVKEAISTVRPIAIRKVIQFSSFIDPQLPDCLSGDLVRLRQVLINLIGNSVKFSECGTISVSVTQIHDSPQNNSLVLLFSIKDEGIGIPKAKLETIFARFNQANHSTTRLYGLYHYFHFFFICELIFG